MSALLGLGVLALGALVVLAAVLLALAGRRRTPATIGCALAGAALLVVWVVLTARAGVRADGRGTTATVYDDAQWWALAVLAALTSLALTARHRRR
ncbi:hypothetical protein [Kineococcus rhizosphaerae]|uniref:Uncharacterized protein n=1 Tax=Kineococcus rhizosphaerae TaxID=559628 RepID=A0A2T0RA22_9ACTN|nr:hypothetical protein [Kineococcus rhizosphaerae]PRY18018.1 hypothetical protein CLV37_101262 [Kineococcus rhizosphaerae]